MTVLKRLVGNKGDLPVKTKANITCQTVEISVSLWTMSIDLMADALLIVSP